MKALIYGLILSSAVLIASTSLAAQIQPLIQNQQLGIALSDIDWPASLRKDFISGFENRILIRATVMTGEKPIATRDLVIVEKYDLWDELLRIRVTLAAQPYSDKTHKSVDEAIMELRNLSAQNVFPFTLFTSGQKLILRADIFVNPIERERIERVTRWVAENSVPRVAGIAANGAPLTAKPNSLFNSIYEQYVHGAEIAAPWKAILESKPFSLDIPQR